MNPRVYTLYDNLKSKDILNYEENQSLIDSIGEVITKTRLNTNDYLTNYDEVYAIIRDRLMKTKEDRSFNLSLQTKEGKSIAIIKVPGWAEITSAYTPDTNNELSGKEPLKTCRYCKSVQAMLIYKNIKVIENSHSVRCNSCGLTQHMTEEQWMECY